MPQVEKYERIYNMTDVEMLERAQSFHSNLIIDKAVLSAAFPGLADPFAATFQTKIDTADDIPSDSEIVDDNSEIVAALNNMNDPIKVKIQAIYAYVKIAFNDDPVKNKQFGRGKEYNDAFRTHTGVKELLERVFRQADKPAVKTALIAAGATEAMIDDLETTMNTYDGLINDLNDKKDERLQITQDRIVAGNSVWADMVKISDAAKVVFHDNPAKLIIYQLYPPTTNNPHKVQNLNYVSEFNKLVWDIAENADLYVVEAMQQFPLSEPTFTVRAELPMNEWVVALPPATYSFRVKGKNGGLSGPYSDQLDDTIIV